MVILGVALLSPFSSASENQASERFHKEVEPLLAKYCSDCHGDGVKKGDVAFDELKSDEALLNRELWSKVLKNLRAGIMPPDKKPRPSDDERQAIERWIKRRFGIDPKTGPGRVTLRRSTREYRNTIRDLMGFDFSG